jgi:hypothetical protein
LSFEGEYSLYLTEKHEKMTEKDSEKMMIGVFAIESLLIEIFAYVKGLILSPLLFLIIYF